MRAIGVRPFFCAQSAEQTGRRDVDADQAIRAIRRRQLQVVHAHHAHAVDVDDLVIEDLALERQLVRAWLENRRIGQRASEHDVPVVVDAQG